MNKELLLENLRNIPDFPIPGIQFKDVTSLFKNSACLREMDNALYELYKDKGITKIVGIEQFRKQCDIANEGENCGILLHGVSKNDVLRGSSLISPDWSEPAEMPEQNDFMSGYRKVDVSSLNQHDYSSVLNGGEGDKKKWWQKLF